MWWRFLKIKKEEVLSPNEQVTSKSRQVLNIDSFYGNNEDKFFSYFEWAPHCFEQLAVKGWAGGHQTKDECSSRRTLAAINYTTIKCSNETGKVSVAISVIYEHGLHTQSNTQ